MLIVNGPLLRGLRERKGLTLLELSDTVDVDRRTLSSYERKSPASADIVPLTKIAKFHGLAIEDLLMEAPEGICGPVPASIQELPA